MCDRPTLYGSVVIFITSNSVIIQIWWLGCAKLSYVNRSSRIYFWFRTRLTLSFFLSLSSCPRLRLLLHRPHCKPRQSPRLAPESMARALSHRHRVAQVCKFPQLVPRTDEALLLISRHKLNLLERSHQRAALLLTRRVQLVAGIKNPRR